MRGPLSEGLPPGAPEMADFDAAVADLDHRRSLTTEFDPATDERYARCYRRYREWCALPDVRQQSGPDSITAEKIRDFTVHMVTVGSAYTGKRYTLETLWTTIRALQLFAERAGLAVSTEPALAVVDSYRVKTGNPPKRRRRRRRPSTTW